MSRETGKPLPRLEHIQQAVADILTTPVGTRVCRRDYGSRLFELVDRPINPSLVGDAIAAVAEALQRWEPRIRVDRVLVDSELTTPSLGRLAITVEGRILATGEGFRLEPIAIS